MPTEEPFFDLFDDIAKVLVDAAVCLHDLISDYQNVDEKCHVLREMEKSIDAATDGIVQRLNMSFVTPIDREDIHGLATSLDDVLDYIEASADRMNLYGVDKPREEAAELAAILIESTKQIRDGIHGLSTFRDIETILRPCVEINKLENQADQVQRKALRRLFKEETKPLEIAKWMEIFDRLETATDKCEDVANVLESIVVKNA
jgi:hypothetical protein